LQIGERERDAQTENMFKDIVNFIAEKCVHPESKRPFSIDSIKAAINEIHFPIKLDQSAKKQALDCFKQLHRRFYIVRAEMKVKISANIASKEA
jgi:ribosome maturation protein SDO1